MLMTHHNSMGNPVRELLGAGAGVLVGVSVGC
jgi:hypothetical protein